MRRAPAVLLLALVAVPRVGWTQGGVPIGPEFRANTYTTGVQSGVSVAADPEARFVVVWESDGQDGSDLGIFGQFFFINGIPQGPEFRVNTYTTSFQNSPSVAMTGAGNFVVAWQSWQDGDGSGVFGQRFLAGGLPNGPEFRVNTYTTGHQYLAAAATDIIGNFVVVWNGAGEGDTDGIFGQRFAAGSGVPLGPEFRVNTYTTGIQHFPAVASDFGGNFVVVWQDGSLFEGGRGVFGQRFDSSGAPVGPEFQVETYTTGLQGYPSVAADASGDFVVVWASETPGPFPAVFGQRYSSTGVPLGPQFQVNTYTGGALNVPARVTSDGSGNFVVVWGSGPDGDSWGVFGQRYASSGDPVGSEFLVNTYTTRGQMQPAVGTIGGGTFVVAWESYGQDGSSWGVFSQRYSAILPVELMRFGVE
jgi:hypothetical protein